jgi:hypothetical protein
MVARAPHLAEQLIGSIPRLEAVRGILALHLQPPARISAAQDELVSVGARILRLAVEYEALESEGLAPAAAIATLRGRGFHDAALLDVLAAHRGADRRRAIRELPLRGLTEGMVLAADVRLRNGALLVGRGYEITHGFLERARNLGAGAVIEPIRVFVADRAAPPPAYEAARPASSAPASRDSRWK